MDESGVRVRVRGWGWGFGVWVRVEIERLFSVALRLSRHGPGVGDRFGGGLSMVEHGREPTQFPVRFGSVATAVGTLHECMYGAVHEAGRDMQAKELDSSRSTPESCVCAVRASINGVHMPISHA